MKKQILAILAIMIQFNTVLACDICGCGVGNNYVGILPEFRKHTIGLRYKTSSIYTNLGIGATPTYMTNKEVYNTIELWGGFKLSNKWRLLATVPYSFNHRNTSTGARSKAGIGDINGLFFYELINTRRTTNQSKLLINTLWIGTGLKLPTGQYNAVDKNTTNSNNLFQLGTGSVDISIVAMYDLRLQDAGININGQYKINTTNRYDYRFGNKGTISTQLYYKWRIANQFTIAPSAGLLMEQSALDYDKKKAVDISKGQLTMATFGFEGNVNKIAFGINWQTPLKQEMGLGTIQANNRGMIHLSYLF